MTRTLWLVMTFVVLWSRMPATQQTRSTLSMAEAQEAANSGRPSGFEVEISTLTGYPHRDDADLRKAEAALTLGLMPELVARGDVLKEGSHLGSRRVQFYNGEASPLDLWKGTFFGFRGALPIDNAEQARLRQGLNLFASNALDVSSGSSRWSRSLPTRVRDFAFLDEFGDTGRSSEATVMRFVTSWLDLNVLTFWLALEQPQRLTQFAAESGSAMATNDVKAIEAVIDRYHPQLVSALKSLTPSHLQSDIGFLTEVLFGAWYKVRNGDFKNYLKVATLPESAELYLVQFSLNGMLLFQRSGARLTLVNIGTFSP